MSDVVIVGAARTAVGSFLGGLATGAAGRRGTAPSQGGLAAVPELVARLLTV